jgi:hypothetical protein
VSWISEPGLRLEGDHPRAMALAARAAFGAPAGAEEPMDVSPDEVTIQATVEACFQLVTGD